MTTGRGRVFLLYAQTLQREIEAEKKRREKATLFSIARLFYEDRQRDVFTSHTTHKLHFIGWAV